MRQYLRGQRQLLEPLRRYGEMFGTDATTGLLKGSFRLYRAPLSDLTVVPVPDDLSAIEPYLG